MSSMKKQGLGRFATHGAPAGSTPAAQAKPGGRFHVAASGTGGGHAAVFAAARAARRFGKQAPTGHG